MNRSDISRLQKNRSIYLKIGMITALTFAIFAFNWTTDLYDPNEDIVTMEDQEDVIPVVRTVQFEKRLPPPPVIETTTDLLIEDPEMIIEPEPIKKVPVSILPEPVISTPEPAPVPVAAPRPKPILLPEEPKTVIPEIFEVVEEMPRFPGCEDTGLSKKEKKTCADKKMLEYVYKNIKYPKVAVENNISGMALIRFVVEKDGSISDLQIVKEPGGGCGTEVLRVVKKMPKWLPGKQRGRKVRVYYNLPVVYRLD